MNARGVIALGAAAFAALVLILLVGALNQRAPVAASPTPTTTPIASFSSTPSSSPTATAAATPTAPAGGRYVSTVGYSIETTAPWRLSSCTRRFQGFESMGEGFVPVPAREEISSDIGAQYTTLSVLYLANPQNLTPRQWAEQGRGISGTVAGQIEDVSYAGRQAARKSTSVPGLFTYVVPNAGFMYIVNPLPREPLDASLRTSLVRMIDSFQFISDTERAAARAALPPAPPPRTAEQVADGLAAAFSAKDTSALSALAAPCVFRFGEQAGGTTASQVKYFEELGAAFASGLSVTVQPRPITVDPNLGNQTYVTSTWQDARGSQTRKLILMRGPNDRWEWVGTLERYQ